MATKTLAVSANDANKYGCPHCGGIYGYPIVQDGSSVLWSCDGCGQTSIYLATGVKVSTIGVGNSYPRLCRHPRKGHPTNRNKLVSEREKFIKSEAYSDLGKWIELGYGRPVRIMEVGEHTSKSECLPILGTESAGGTKVTWAGYNYYFYFLGVELAKAIPATLLYPISGLFGSYPLSGHVNTKVSPPLTNFLKAYHNVTPVKVFGGDCGGDGILMALAIRYLEEVSKLDAKAILDVCLRKTSYGNLDHIDGNAIEFEDLVKLLNLKYEGFAYYDFFVQNKPEAVFKKVNVDWFASEYGSHSSAVHVVMQDGVYLPPLPLPAPILVDLRDTALTKFVPPELQQRPLTGTTDTDCIVQKIPVDFLNFQKERHPREERALQGRYEPHGLYHCVNPGTTHFTFQTPNVLDCAMTAFFLVKVLGPIIMDATSKLGSP